MNDDLCMTIEIALAADAGYFCGLLVTACSIAKYADKQSFLHFHVLDGGLSSAQWESLKEKTSRFHPNVTFNRINVDEKDFKDYPSWNNSRMIYTRLMLPKLLKDTDWVIYCDVDFLWLDDIGELWKMRDNDYCFIGVLDPVKATRESDAEWAKNHSLSCNADEYCCAGLSFLNLAAFRREGLFEQSMSLMEMRPPYNDQTIFNIVASGRKRIVGIEWQCFTRCLTQQLLDKGVVIHHAGEIPWKPIAKTRGFQFLSDTMLLWHRFNAEIHGKSVLWSLRQHFSMRWIIVHRGACLFFRFLPVNLFCKWILSAMRHRGVYDVMQTRARKFHPLP